METTYETVLPTEAATVPATEPTAVEIQETLGQDADSTVTETVEQTEPTDPTEAPGESTGETVPVETIPSETFWEETIPEATEVVAVDYTQPIADSTCVLANVILCAALIIVGFFSAVKFWGA